MPKTHSDKDLWKYSDEHIAYEVERFFWLAGLLADSSTTLSAPTINDTLRLNHSLIEAFALHLRNLLEFLYDKKAGDHIVAAQFCNPGVWERERKAKPSVLGKAWGRANEEVAHLTDKRKSGYAPEKWWPFKEIVCEIKPLILRLRANASPDRLSPKVVEAIDTKPGKTSRKKLVGIGPAVSPGSQERLIMGMTGPAAPREDIDNGKGGKNGTW